MRWRMIFALVLVGNSTVFVSAAKAAIVNLTFDFSATNFLPLPRSGEPRPSPFAPPPFATVTGSFSFTFDDTGGIPENTTNGVVLNAFSLPLESPLALASSSGTFTFGGFADGVSAIRIGTDDFTFVITDIFTSQPRFVTFVYGSRLAPLDVYFTQTGCVNGFCVAPVAVPEPTSWALMILGFGIVGAAARRRRSARFSYV